MPTGKFLVLVAIFFLTSLISVVTGSTSLITVPVMIALGIKAHVAVATNMLALTFMSVGGSLPFMGKSVLSHSRLVPSIRSHDPRFWLGRIPVAHCAAQGSANYYRGGHDWRGHFLCPEQKPGTG